MARTYHVLIGPETTFGTYNATDQQAIPMMSAEGMLARQSDDGRYTGFNRALRELLLTNIEPAADMEFPWWQERMGHLLRAALLHDVTSQLVTTSLAYEHGFVPDDGGAATGSDKWPMSIEIQHTASEGQFLQGAVLDSLSVEADESGVMSGSASWLALDLVKAGGTWSDGSSAPSLTGSPGYFGSSIQPFLVNNIEVILDPTISLTSGMPSYTGGSTDSDILTVSVELENNLEFVHGKNQQINPTNIHVGARDVTVTLTKDWTSVDTTFFDSMRSDGTHSMVIRVTGAVIEESEPYALEWYFEELKVPEAEYPSATGEIDLPEHEITLRATQGSNHDVMARLVDTKTDYNTT